MAAVARAGAVMVAERTVEVARAVVRRAVAAMEQRQREASSQRASPALCVALAPWTTSATVTTVMAKHLRG